MREVTKLKMIQLYNTDVCNGKAVYKRIYAKSLSKHLYRDHLFACCNQWKNKKEIKIE